MVAEPFTSVRLQRLKKSDLSVFSEKKLDILPVNLQRRDTDLFSIVQRLHFQLWFLYNIYMKKNLKIYFLAKLKTPPCFPAFLCT